MLGDGYIEVRYDLIASIHLLLQLASFFLLLYTDPRLLSPVLTLNLGIASDLLLGLLRCLSLLGGCLLLIRSTFLLLSEHLIKETETRNIHKYIESYCLVGKAV